VRAPPLMPVRRGSTRTRRDTRLSEGARDSVARLTTKDGLLYTCFMNNTAYTDDNDHDDDDNDDDDDDERCALP
jgi:hypothetical protein